MQTTTVAASLKYLHTATLLAVSSTTQHA